MHSGNAAPPGFQSGPSYRPELQPCMPCIWRQRQLRSFRSPHPPEPAVPWPYPSAGRMQSHRAPGSGPKWAETEEASSMIRGHRLESAAEPPASGGFRSWTHTADIPVFPQRQVSGGLFSGSLHSTENAPDGLQNSVHTAGTADGIHPAVFPDSSHPHCPVPSGSVSGRMLPVSALPRGIWVPIPFPSRSRDSAAFSGCF